MGVGNHIGTTQHGSVCMQLATSLTPLDVAVSITTGPRRSKPCPPLPTLHRCSSQNPVLARGKGVKIWLELIEVLPVLLRCCRRPPSPMLIECSGMHRCTQAIGVAGTVARQAATTSSGDSMGSSASQVTGCALQEPARCLKLGRNDLRLRPTYWMTGETDSCRVRVGGLLKAVGKCHPQSVQALAKGKGCAGHLSRPCRTSPARRLEKAKSANR